MHLGVSVKVSVNVTKRRWLTEIIDLTVPDFYLNDVFSVFSENEKQLLFRRFVLTVV